MHYRNMISTIVDFWLLHNYLREGRQQLEEALALNPGAPAPLRARALAGAGTLAAFQGDSATARALLRESLQVAESLHDTIAMARALSRLGLVALLEGDGQEAQALEERSLALYREMEDLRGSLFATQMLAWALELLGDLKRADAAGEAGRSRAPWFAVTIAALVSAERGDLEHAVRSLAAVDAWSKWTGDVFVSRDLLRELETDPEFIARTRRRLGESLYEAAISEGRAMSARGAVDMARGCATVPAAGGADQVSPHGDHPARPLLSEREQAVLRLIADGLPNKHIATSLGIAPRTVKTHVTSAMNKLGVDNRAHAAVVAIRRELL